MNKFRTILVISYDGQDPDKIAEKYSTSLKVNPKIAGHISDEEFVDTYFNYIDLLVNTVDNKDEKSYKDTAKAVAWMTPLEFYKSKYNGSLDVDEDNNLIEYHNDNAEYEFPKCYQKSFEKWGEEATFSNPFHLKNGESAYRAHLNDINWDIEHGYRKELYDAAWEICVNGSEPRNEEERVIAERMSNRNEYFSNFNSKEEYVAYSTCFWMFGVATEEKYTDAFKYEENKKDGGLKWATEFYDTFIKSLEGNPLLSIYEVRMLDATNSE